MCILAVCQVCNVATVMFHVCIIHVFSFCSGSELGQWSVEGLTTEILTGGRVVCTSTHLTSFSVLVAVEEAPVCKYCSLWLLYCYYYCDCCTCLVACACSIVCRPMFFFHTSPTLDVASLLLVYS